VAMQVLIYDRECSLCHRGMEWVSRRALPGEFEFIPCQSAERRERFPWMAEEVCLQAIQLILPDGEVLGGHAAIPEILRRLRGWRWVALLFRIPGMRWLAPQLYQWVAHHRYAISCALSSRVEAP